MRTLAVTVAGLLFLAIGGCSPPAPRGNAPLPPDATAAPAEAGAAETSGSAGGGTSAASPAEIIHAEPAPSAPAAIAIPEASGWTHPDVPLARQQSDIEACYQSAAARVARDTRIDEDRYQNRDDGDDVLGLTTFARRVDFYSEKRRRGSLFDSCMRAKGYTKS